jgi:RecJ-like exonuclease
MKKYDPKAICEKCTKPYCHEEVVCPECNGQGLPSDMSTAEESEDYGLNFTSERPCLFCDGRGTTTVYCPQYMDRPVPASSLASGHASKHVASVPYPQF